MPSTDEIWFETQRRIVLFKEGTVMPDGSLLGYNGNPNNTNNSTPGQTLLLNSPIGTLFIQTDGTMWRKTVLATNTWVTLGDGTGGSGGSTVNSQLVTRGAFEVTESQATFLTLQDNSFAGDTVWDDITYMHTLVVPYDTTVKRVVLRGTATNGATINIGMHTNNHVNDVNTIDYKFFPEVAYELVENVYTHNNETIIYTFSDTASASAGNTIGISVSADQHIGMVNATIALEYVT